MLARSAIRPRHTNAPRPAWKVAEAFKQWLRGRPCAFEHLGGCEGKMEAAHVADPHTKGMGTKAADRWCLPACQHHHREHTFKGWSALGITRDQGHQMAEAYWNAWPGRKAWEAKQ